MRKIFKYECKRLLCNKFFFGLLLVTLFYGWQVLNNVTIFGVSHTAPFSPWSFGDYLSRVIPMLWIGTLFFITFFTSPKARCAAALTDAALIMPVRYAAARCVSALVGSLLLSLACIAEAAVFYGGYFDWYGCGDMIGPAIISLPPVIIFALGSGWLLGRIKSWMVYVWMVIPSILITVPLPELMGILNGCFFTDYPLTIGTLDPAFSVPISVFLTQCSLMVIGLVAMVYQAGRARCIR